MENTLHHHLYMNIIVAVYIASVCVVAEKCTFPTDPCVCQTSQFKLNLTGLMNSRQGADLSVSGDTTYTYYIQPCNKIMSNYFFPCTSKSGSLISCQIDANRVSAYGLGALDQFEATQSTGKFVLTNYFTDPKDFIERRISLTILCGESETFVYTGHDGTESPITFSFILTSKFVCFKEADGSAGISPGSILVIVFFVLIIVYIVGGVLFLKFAKKAEGKEAIPNYTLWSSIPSLIKTGVIFTFSCGKQGKSYESI